MTFGLQLHNCTCYLHGEGDSWQSNNISQLYFILMLKGLKFIIQVHEDGRTTYRAIIYRINAFKNKEHWKKHIF